MKDSAYQIIESSPYGIDFKIAVCSLYDSGYLPMNDNTIVEHISEIESYVLDNGIFIGGKSAEGFFMVNDIDDFIDAFYIALIGDFSPPKSFTKKVTELYKKATTKIK